MTQKSGKPEKLTEKALKKLRNWTFSGVWVGNPRLLYITILSVPISDPFKEAISSRSFAEKNISNNIFLKTKNSRKKMLSKTRLFSLLQLKRRGYHRMYTICFKLMNEIYLLIAPYSEAGLTYTQKEI